MKRSLSIIILLFLVSQVAAQVNARMSLDTNWMLVGEQTQLRISVEYTPADSVQNIEWPTFGDTVTSDIEILEKSSIDTAIQETGDEDFLFTEEQTLVITAFDSGYFAIPPLTFDVDGKKIQTNPLLLEVHLTEVPPDGQMKDIKNVVSPTWTFWDWLKTNLLTIIIVIIVAVLIVAFFLAGGIEGIKKLLQKKKDAPEMGEPVDPQRPPHELAIEALDQLKADKFWQQGMTKHYYISLSNIIREYLERQFAINALEETSYDILQKMRHSQLENATMQMLRQLLSQADLVKFAREKPTPQENEQVLDLAYRFVKETTPEMAAETESKGGRE